MKTLYSKRWYTPRDIARLGLIKNTRGGDNINYNHSFILGLIHSGKLRAKDVSKGKKRSVWLVREDEIERYHNTVTIVN